MKRFLKLAGGLSLVLLVGTGLANAQVMNEIMAGQLDFGSGGVDDPLGCQAASPCNLYQRYYGDLNVQIINADGGVPSTSNDGYPSFAKKAGRWLGDGLTTGNYSGINLVAQACEAWYTNWSGVINPGSANFISYYAAGATIINLAENGNTNAEDCEGTGKGVACFGEVKTGRGRTYTSTPQSPVIIDQTLPASTDSSGTASGLDAVPIPAVTASDQAGGTADLAWPGPQNGISPNTASSTGAACPFGASFNDLLGQAAGTPNPLYAVRLYVQRLAGCGSPRDLATMEGSSLDGTTGSLLALMNPGTQLACTGAADCPGMHQVSCAAATGGTCIGSDFDLSSQSIQVNEATINAALGVGNEMGSGDCVVFNTKIVYRGAVTGSTIAGANTNPSLMSLFSANSTKVGFSGLISSVALEARAGRANTVTLGISTVGGPFTSFSIQRAADGISFVDVATIDATGDSEYTYTDRVPRNSAYTYRLQWETADGDTGQVFETIDMSPSRAPSRR